MMFVVQQLGSARDRRGKARAGMNNVGRESLMIVRYVELGFLETDDFEAAKEG